MIFHNSSNNSSFERIISSGDISTPILGNLLFSSSASCVTVNLICLDTQLINNGESYIGVFIIFGGKHN